MKKIISLILVLSLALCLVPVLAEEEVADEEATELELMSYEDYALAEIDAPVYVETYVQATQSWWDDKITVYAQSEDGAYFIYNMACSQEDAEKLVAGTKIAVKGFKSEWSGEVEITDATFEFIDGDPFIAAAEDVTAKLGTEELINDQNKLVAFKKEEKEFERQEFINRCIDVVAIIVLVAILVIAAVPIIHSICS